MSWEQGYADKIKTPDEALRSVESGMRVYIQPGCAEPETLVEALMRRGPAVRNVEIVHMMTMGCAPYVAPEMAGHFRHNAIFVGANVRQAINDGRADYTPVYLSEVEELFESSAMPIDVALIQVSLPDSHGYCSFGVGVDTTLTAAKCARYVVAQVNSNMPRTNGDSFIHINNINAVVESSRPLCELPKVPITDLQTAIARNVAGLIDDGAVLQIGIGGIPNAVLPFLSDRKDLGVHSELVSDGVIPLIEAGVITGARKTFKPRKIVVGFALGTKKLFDFVDNNPVFRVSPDRLYQRSRTYRPQRQYGGHKLRLANRPHRPGLFGFGRHPVLQRNRRASRLPARSLALEGRQAHHRDFLDCQEWKDFTNRPHAEPGRGRRHVAWPGALCGDGIWSGVPAREDNPPTGTGADRNRASRLPRGTL